MKNKLLNVLNHCIYNKSIADFNAIIELVNTINDDDITDINIKHSKTGVYVSMFNSDYKLISVSFTDTNMLLFCLPSDVSKTYIIENDGYNISYSDLSNILNDVN